MTVADAWRTQATPAGAVSESSPQARPRLRGLLAARFVDEAMERAYRAYFLELDKRQAIIAIGVYALLKASYAVVDVLVQPDDGLAAVLAFRFAFVASCVLAMALLARVRRHGQYDALVFAWACLLVASNFFTFSQRLPEDFGFALTSPMTVLLLFAFFRNRIELQLLAACLVIATEAFVLLAMRVPAAPALLAQLALSHFIALLVGVLVSRQLKYARRKVYAALASERSTAEAMRELAFRDDLTGVLNRRSFLQLAEAGWSRRTQGEGGCVMILDLDHFKALNDRHGHEAGDRALVRFARMVDAVKREEDLFGRIGGEEFALLLPGVAQRRAQTVAEAIVAGCRALQGEGGDTLSVSIGLARIRSEDITLSACMQRADRALYRAKHGGRGRSCNADEESGEGAESERGVPAA